MLSKNDYEAIQKQLAECNCTYDETDLGRLRKGATGTAHGQFLRNAGTKDLILRDVAAIAKDHPAHRFHVELDGISKFTVKCNGQELLSSDYYEVERLYGLSGDAFRNKLAQAVSEGDPS